MASFHVSAYFTVHRPYFSCAHIFAQRRQIFLGRRYLEMKCIILIDANLEANMPRLALIRIARVVSRPHPLDICA